MGGSRLAARRFSRSLSSWRQRNHKFHSLSSSSSSISPRISAFPTLESATARARKRRRRVAKLETLAAKSSPAARKHTTAEKDNVVPAYPEGKPWRVLWPIAHGNPSYVAELKPVRRIPRWRDISTAWARYLETWEDGLRGEPSPEKLRKREALEAAQAMTATQPHDNDVSSVDKLQTNVSQNLQVAKDSAADLLEQAKEKTDIRSKDDLQRVAGDMMKLATECVKEFMAGYRQGRDQEVDKMLHEYFREETPDAEPAVEAADSKKEKKSKRRKPRRAILR